MTLVAGVGVGVGVGGTACTVVLEVAELFAAFGSVVVAATVAVLSIVDPAGPVAVATSVMSADAPVASDAKVTVRLFPLPPQTPPPVEEHDTKVTVTGRLSVTTTD